MRMMSCGFGVGMRGVKKLGSTSSFDPATLALTGWWRASYGASPWTGTASAGASGTRDLTEATNPPGTSAIGSYNAADFDGVNDKLDNATALASNYLGASAASFAVLFWADSAAADTAASAVYNLPGLVVEATNGHLAMGFGTGGVRFGFYAASYGTWQSLAVAASTGAWHLGQAKYDGAKIYVRVDNGAWSELAHAHVPSPAAGPRVGAKYNGGAFFDGRIAEVMIAATAFDSDTFDSLREYVNARYGIAV